VSLDVTKRVLAKLDAVYSLAALPGGGFAVGSEADGPLLFFESFDAAPRALADGPGGFISLCPLERGGRRGLVASVDFKPVFQAADCRILLIPLDGGEATEVARLPYTHRIAVVEVGGQPCFLGSTLCSHKDCTQDWTHPGGIHVGAIPDDPAQPWALRELPQPLTRNHGMDPAPGGFLVSATEGLFRLRLPDRIDGEWVFERIAEGEHSDAFACPLTGDILALSPFHGNVLSRYRGGPSGWEREVMADDIDMGHIVWAGKFLGGPAVIAGGRRGRKELRLYREGRPCEVIDEGIGAAQMLVFDGNRLVFAGHATGEVLLYELQG